MQSFLGPSLVIFIGGFIAVCGAYWAATQQDQQQRELNRKNDEIAILAKENAALSKQVFDAIQGGDSYPFVIYIHINRTAGPDEPIQLQAYIFLNGDNPVDCLGGREENHTRYTSALERFNKNGKANAQGQITYSQQQIDELEIARGTRLIPATRLHPYDPDTRLFEGGVPIPGIVSIPSSAKEWEFSAQINCRNGKFVTATRLEFTKVTDHPELPNGGYWDVTDTLVKERRDGDLIMRRDWNNDPSSTSQ
ncbi:MAG: hypothetical protein ABJO01_10090 [Parasphingorhabdus sp.]|uniref:hypothetical protein n=1 Tax=Parasphingorhabdus sp. TaxID=2709688 RepID=UPI00329727D0